jgi:hypothetical protein
MNKDPTGRNLFTFFDNWEGTNLFKYIVFGLAVLWLFSYLKWGIEMLIGLIVAYQVISYVNFRDTKKKDTLGEQFNFKKESLRPNIENLNSERNNVVDLLFSINDFYKYNPLQYEEMSAYIKRFFELYDLTQIEKNNASINYQLMETYKRNSLNSLHSLILSLPNDFRVSEKLSESISILDKILTEYLNEISYVADNYVFKNGYNNNIKMIDYGPKEFNSYPDIFGNFSYNIY